MYCLADEAHGTHFYFGDGMPVSAMEAGADMGLRVHAQKRRQPDPVQLACWWERKSTPGMCGRLSTSPRPPPAATCSCPAWTSARREPGPAGPGGVRQGFRHGRLRPGGDQRNRGLLCLRRELINGNSVFDFDPTKLSIHTRDIGLAGIEVYDILRDEYDIQNEFGDIGNILAYLSIGDRPQELERLVSALAEIRRRYQKDGSGF